jgi:hypothetical protein
MTTKEQRKAMKNYYEENKTIILNKRAELRQTEEYKLMMKNYAASDVGKKSRRITTWKRIGVISDDYDALYIKYKETTHCEECNCEFIEGSRGKNKKALDHDHKTGAFRNIICNSCNIKRGFKDAEIIKLTNDQRNQNRRWKTLILKFELKWAFKKLISQL